MTKIKDINKGNSHQSGYIALVSVLIVGAVGLVFSITFSQQRVESYRTRSASHKGARAAFNSETCGEEALLKLRDNLDYSGDESLNLSRGSCYIRPTATTTEGDYKIETKGVVDNYQKKLRILVGTTSPTFKIKTWQFVPDF